MSYRHYQNTAPGWGTSQFQFGAPPTPNFQPQPSWGGFDYYRAHAVNPDPSLYNHAWNRVRNYSDAAGSNGVGSNEARHWHRRAYGGLGELAQMLPSEIGHAAAYEAYRTWIHNSSIYEPLSGDTERQREALIGLAVAEAARLLQYSSRQGDNYARMEASESAATTASIIFYQSRDNGEDEYRSRSRSRLGSFSGSSYSSSGDPYAYDNARAYPRPRSHSRHRSQSRHRSHSSASHHRPNLVPYMSSTPSHHSHHSHHSSGMPIPSPNVVPPGYAGSGSYGSYGSQGSYYDGGMHIHGHGSPYGSPMPMSVPAGSSYGSSIPMVVPAGSSRHRSLSMSMPYGQTPYMGGGGTMAPAPTTIILAPKKHKHKHSHSHSKSKRSRSIEPAYGYTTSMRY